MFPKLERWFDVLDGAAWQTSKLEAAPHLMSKWRESGRGWQEIFDIFHEARTFECFQSICCIEAHSTLSSRRAH